MVIHCNYDKLVPIAELKSNPRNPNRHPKEQIERLAKILNYQGWRYPVKVSKQSGFVTSGHGRIEAAKINGWTECPVNFQDYDTPDQEYSDLIADNSIASWAELDLEDIKIETAELKDFDLDLLGLKDFEPLVSPDIDDFSDDTIDTKERIKFYTCPHCEKEFKEKQAMVRVQ